MKVVWSIWNKVANPIWLTMVLIKLQCNILNTCFLNFCYVCMLKYWMNDLWSEIWTDTHKVILRNYVYICYSESYSKYTHNFWVSLYDVCIFIFIVKFSVHPENRCIFIFKNFDWVKIYGHSSRWKGIKIQPSHLV